MKKLLILTHPDSATWFNSEPLQTLFAEWFEIQPWDSSTTYDPATTFLAVYHKNDSAWWEPLYAQGFRLLIDSVSEPHTWYRNFFSELTPGSYHVITENNWFWYVDALNFSRPKEYVPQRNYSKLALMPLSRQKRHRTRLVEAMAPWLDQCIYSYADRGITLPNDIERTANWDRNFNPAWYNDTCFSLVAETWTDNMQDYQLAGLKKIPYNGPRQFVTEKTFKPIEFQHPFMIYGQQGTLSYLRSQGFETFENLFDESYDVENNRKWSEPDIKLNIIIDNVANFEKRPYDSVTQAKIQHNYNHFMSVDHVLTRIKNETMLPILEFVNAK